MKVSESQKQALIKPCNLPQTRSKYDVIWASTREALSTGVRKQPGRRQPAHPRSLISALDNLLFGKNHIWACYHQNFIFLVSLCSWWDWFGWKTRRQVFLRWGPYESWYFSLFRVKENELRVKRIQENLAKKPVRTRVRKAGGLVSFVTVL